MDIIYILKVIVGVLATIVAVYVFVKALVPSANRLGLAGCLLAAVIILFLLYYVFPFGSIQDTIAAYTALIALTVIGALNILKWAKILPTRRWSWKLYLPIALFAISILAIAFLPVLTYKIDVARYRDISPFMESICDPSFRNSQSTPPAIWCY